MKLKLLFFGIFLAAFAVTTQAQTATPHTTARQVKQQKRIKRGVKSDELTRGEVVQLEAQQAKINRTKRRAKADGQVTAGEKARIQHQQNQANRNIRRKKHNNRDRN